VAALAPVAAATSVVAAAAASALRDPAHAVKLDGTPGNKNAAPAHTASAQTGNSTPADRTDAPHRCPKIPLGARPRAEALRALPRQLTLARPRRWLYRCELLADPRRLARRRIDADVPGDVDFVPDGEPCRLRWPDTADYHANAANVHLLVGTPSSNNVPADNLAETSTHSPSAGNAAVGHSVLEKHHPMCNSAGRSREVLLPTIQSRKGSVNSPPGRLMSRPLLGLPYLRPPSSQRNAPPPEFNTFPRGPRHRKSWLPPRGKPTRCSAGRCSTAASRRTATRNARCRTVRPLLPCRKSRAKLSRRRVPDRRKCCGACRRRCRPIRRPRSWWSRNADLMFAPIVT